MSTSKTIGVVLFEVALGFIAWVVLTKGTNVVKALVKKNPS